MTRVAFPAKIAVSAFAATLAVTALSLPAHAQKQEYAPWVYDQMVPTGPLLRNLDQAQPLPGPAPSHWGAMKAGKDRASMTRYGTDVKRTDTHYSASHSLTPPPVDPAAAKRVMAPPQSADAPPVPRTARRD
ncbi:hypothetical protein J2848_006449 [Azospirillum lipoferum]|uniref:Uncharacterized protein n=1 Tax=Azospirillum lipoferum TaxID=193 RepID=A0A5A9GC50_AZOLI|nr:MULTISPECIES: hypothetical protein [Azospirillum]KAA0591941.1 hypothetical protein FZ942_30345 [Azospirillum lipoferum]MCP1614742.1 hypothetical protein [Azospirillum lipoferum]MDW5537422.1 hypothetical protein [Azospirillum sp. NL1]